MSERVRSKGHRWFDPVLPSEAFWRAHNRSPHHFLECVGNHGAIEPHDPGPVEYVVPDLTLDGCVRRVTRDEHAPCPACRVRAAWATWPDHPRRAALFCPACGGQHVDQGEWANRIHTTHRCSFCGEEWRPFTYPTVGVPLGPGELGRMFRDKSLQLIAISGDPDTTFQTTYERYIRELNAVALEQLYPSDGFEP